MFTPHHVSCATCHMSCVNCYMSHVICHMSHVTCHMSHVTCHMSDFFKILQKRASCAGCRCRPSPAEAPTIGKIHPFSKMTVTIEPLHYAKKEAFIFQPELPAKVSLSAKSAFSSTGIKICSFSDLIN